MWTAFHKTEFDSNRTFARVAATGANQPVQTSPYNRCAATRMVVDAIADRGRAPMGVGCGTLSVERFPLVNFLLETQSLPALARRYPCGFTFYLAHPIRSIPAFLNS